MKRLITLLTIIGALSLTGCGVPGSSAQDQMSQSRDIMGQNFSDSLKESISSISVR